MWEAVESYVSRCDGPACAVYVVRLGTAREFFPYRVLLGGCGGVYECAIRLSLTAGVSIYFAYQCASSGASDYGVSLCVHSPSGIRDARLWWFWRPFEVFFVWWVRVLLGV